MMIFNSVNATKLRNTNKKEPLATVGMNAVSSRITGNDGTFNDTERASLKGNKTGLLYMKFWKPECVFLRLSLLRCSFSAHDAWKHL